MALGVGLSGFTDLGVDGSGIRVWGLRSRAYRLPEGSGAATSGWLWN